MRRGHHSQAPRRCNCHACAGSGSKKLEKKQWRRSPRVARADAARHEHEPPVGRDVARVEVERHVGREPRVEEAHEPPIPPRALVPARGGVVLSYCVRVVRRSPLFTTTTSNQPPPSNAATTSARSYAASGEPGHQPTTIPSGSCESAQSVKSAVKASQWRRNLELGWIAGGSVTVGQRSHSGHPGRPRRRQRSRPRHRPVALRLAPLLLLRGLAAAELPPP